MIPQALECGMTIDQFWDSTDIETHAYEKAYLNRTNNQAWFQGMYNFQAQTIALHNMFEQNPSKRINYPNNPISFKEPNENLKCVETKEVIEDVKEKNMREALMSCY